MRQLIERREFVRSQLGPVQGPGCEVFAAVSGEFKKGIVGLWNVVELARNDADNRGMGGNGAQGSGVAPQLLIRLMTLAKIAHHSGKTV